MRLAIVCIILFVASVILSFPDPEPIPWGKNMCAGHGGLRKQKTGPLGEKTAICKDGCRHTWTPSIKDKMEIMKNE